MSEKQQGIVEVASNLFYEQGYGATGVKQIIDEAEIAKGTFYSHFRSKEELGVAWLQGSNRSWSEWIENSIAGAKEPGEKILATFDFMEAWMSDCQYRGCAFINTMTETPDGESPLRHEVTASKLGLRTLFETLASAHYGEQTEELAIRKARHFYLLFEGALVEAQLFQDRWPIELAREEVASQLADQNSPRKQRKSAASQEKKSTAR